jgi:hypothetical protein
MGDRDRGARDDGLSMDEAPGDLRVPVAPLPGGGPSRGRRTLVAGLVAIVVVVGAAAWLAQAFPAGPAAASLSAALPATAVPTVGPNTLAPRLDRSTFAARVRDGALEDRLVFADAELRRVYCENEGIPTCAAPKLSIPGLPVDIVAGDPVRGRSLVVPHRALLVFLVHRERLEYYGSLLTHPDGSPTLAELTAEVESADPAAREPTLRDAGGWLVIGAGCRVTPAATPCASMPFLADDEPLPDGTLRSDAGTRVALSDAVWGIDPASDGVTPGPFLVRPTDAARQAAGVPAWEIVARYDPPRSVRVVIP